MAEKTDITNDTPPDVIEQDIARTRAEMSDTVNEIQDRLSPGRIREEARDRIRGGIRNVASRISRSAKERGASLMDTVRSNPMPLAMIGIGAAWLLISRSRYRRTFEEAGSDIREKTGDLGERARSKAEELSGRLRETSGAFAGKTRSSAVQMGRSARDQATAAWDRLQEMIDDNPLGMSLAAFAAGALIGFGIPESRKEAELMGAASESLLSRAKETAQRTIQKAQHAAEKAVQSAEEEFRKTA